MAHRKGYWLPLAAALAASACTTPQTADWIASLDSVCIEVEQAYAGVPSHQEPIGETLQGVLSRAGIDARLGAGTGCQATLRLTGKMTPAAKHYSGAPQDCYTEVAGRGTASLVSPRGRVRFPLDFDHIGGPIITICPTTPEDAPFSTAWGEALVPVLEAWWGSPVLAAAVESDNWALRAGAVARLQATTGLDIGEDAAAWREALGLEPSGATTTGAPTTTVGPAPTVTPVPPEEPVPPGS